MDDLAPGDADHPVAGRLQRGVAGAVALERLSRRVVDEAVDLDDQPLLAPQQIDLDAVHDHVRVGSRQPCLADQRQQPALGLRAGEAGLVRERRP